MKKRIAQRKVLGVSSYFGSDFSSMGDSNI